MLAEFAELAMDLARDAAQRAKQAEGGAEAAGLMLAFERLGRSLRLTISLQRRLGREARTERAEAVETRRQQVRSILTPVVRAESRDTGERLRRKEELDERLAEKALDEAFVDAPLDVCIARIRTLLGLAPAESADDVEVVPAPPVSRVALQRPAPNSAATPRRQRFGPS